MVFRIKRKTATAIIFIMCSCLLSWLLTHNVKTEAMFTFINLIGAGIISFYIIINTVSMPMSRITQQIVWGSFATRAAVVLIAIYCNGPISAFLNSGDQKGFLELGKNYFYGDFSGYATKFPYVINIIYQIFGQNRMMVQFLNILLWYVGVKYLVRAAKGIYGKKKELLMLFYCFLLNQIWVTTAVLREGIISTCLMISMFYLWQWMKNGQPVKLLMSALITLPAVLLHTGNVAFFGIIFLVYCLWNYREGKWEIFTWKAWLLILVIIFAVPIYEKVLVRLFPVYLNPTLSIESIGERRMYSSRANYLDGQMVAHNMPQFILYTIYRSFYFWASPTPRFWSSPLDILGFMMDTVPWIYLFYKLIQAERHHRLNKGSKVWILIILVFTFLYGWGTWNAGTAMRHRDQIAGLIVMAVYLGMQGTSFETEQGKRWNYKKTGGTIFCDE